MITSLIIIEACLKGSLIRKYLLLSFSLMIYHHYDHHWEKTLNIEHFKQFIQVVGRGDKDPLHEIEKELF